MNLILVLVEILIIFSAIIFITKRQGKEGIYGLIVILCILSNIMALKEIELFNLNINLGFVSYIGIFLCCNILIQQYGIIELKKVIYIVLICLLLLYSFIMMSCAIFPSDYNILSNRAYDYIFFSNIRIYLASIISVVVSLYIGGNIYYIIRKVRNKILISNFLSIIFSQFVDTIIFIIIAFAFDMSIIDLVSFIVIRYIIKMIVGLLGTNVIYLSCKIKN